jgi:Tfp pilus assembly protein PilX
VRMISRRLRDESGFALVSVLMLMLVGTAFALAAWTTSNADSNPSARDRSSKQAYAAAEAGINYYLFRLGQDNAYWTNCDQVPAPSTTDPNPVNIENATTLRWRNVPGTTSKYAIELLEQNLPSGQNATGSWCNTGAGASASLLDSATGTLQIRSTGQTGGVRRSVVATLRRTGFLDYLYFTDFETQDPQVTSSGLTCNVYRRAGRSSSCSSIVFASDDVVNGPFHTNDDILTCGTPDFGRTTADNIEISAPAPGYASGCGGSATPNFKGTYSAGAKILTLPPSNTSLQSVAQPNYLYTGTTQITLNNASMTVTNGGTTVTRSLDAPFNGVIYVKNGATCGAAYSSPQTYNEPAGCGNVYVQGTTTRSLTIGSERDIIVTGDLKRSGNVLMGLIANFFVRVYHPVSGSCGDTASGPFGPSISSVQIDAAILSLQHSFIVDNYACGSPRGTLTVNGAIGQQFRGPVGTGGSSISTGYVKNYNYDDRFKVANPPYFLDPVQSSWRKIRFTEQTPARAGG